MLQSSIPIYTENLGHFLGGVLADKRMQMNRLPQGGTIWYAPTCTKQVPQQHTFKTPDSRAVCFIITTSSPNGENKN